MTTLRFLRALLAINLRSAVSLRGAFLLQASLMLLNNLLLFTLWWVLFQRFDHIGSWRLPDMLVLYGLVAAGYGFAVLAGGGVRELGRLIANGGLDCYLTQPKDVLLQAVASRSVASGFGDLASGLILLGLSGQISFATAPLALFGALASAVVFVAAGVLFHACAFWLGNVATLAHQAWEFLLAFSLQPAPIFNGWLRVLLFTLMPAGFVGFLPAALVREPSWTAFLSVLAGTTAFSVLSVVVFRLGLRRYVSGNQLSLRS